MPLSTICDYRGLSLCWHQKIFCVLCNTDNYPHQCRLWCLHSCIMLHVCMHNECMWVYNTFSIVCVSMHVWTEFQISASSYTACTLKIQIFVKINKRHDLFNHIVSILTISVKDPINRGIGIIFQPVYICLLWAKTPSLIMSCLEITTEIRLFVHSALLCLTYPADLFATKSVLFNQILLNK